MAAAAAAAGGAGGDVPLLERTQYAYGATTEKGKLELITFTPDALGEHDVFVDIKYGGMCHSDVHQIDNDWGMGKYPMVPGHEVIGVVNAVGSKVTTVAVGDTVGFGPQRGSCGSCEYCAGGIDQDCSEFEGLYNPKFGGYATSITVHERFTFKVPAGIPLEVAGPLLCAGVTTYAPLARFAKAGNRVGIVGIGGLGHMALQYSAAMGCETWAISTSASKEAEARKFGATHFLVSTDATAMAAMTGKFDFILCAASGKFDVNMYMKLLKPRTNFCIVGLPAVATPLEVAPFSVVMGEKAIVGSMIGGTKDMRAMLEFSAAHKCYPQVEVIDFDRANYGFDRMKEGSARYRMVLKIEGYREAKEAAAAAAAK